MFAVQTIATAALLQANKIPILLLAIAFVLILLATVVLTVRAVRRDKAQTAQPLSDEENAEEPLC